MPPYAFTKQQIERNLRTRIERIERVLVSLQRDLQIAKNELDQLTKPGTYVKVLFEGQTREWWYRLHPGSVSKVKRGSRVTVVEGVFSDKVGTVTEVTTERPDLPYFYDAYAERG